MSGIGRPVTSSAYVMVLRKDLPSPLAPESDDENKPDDKSKSEDKDKNKVDDGKDGKTSSKADSEKFVKDKEPPKVTIDFDRLNQRILALPVPAHNYAGVWAGKEGFVSCLSFQRFGPNMIRLRERSTSSI